MDVAIEGVTLLVEDVERSKAFYQRIPGAVVVWERPGEFVLLRIGQFRLQLLPAGDLVEGAPRVHLEGTTADVDELYEQLSAASIRTHGPPVTHSWGERGFYAVDPDGNEIEFATPWRGSRQARGAPASDP